MCSILVFAKLDNDHPNPDEDWKKFKRGDVIAVRDEDDFFWGNDVHGPKPLGWWRVIVVPGVPAKEFEALAMGDSVRPEDWGTETPRRLRVSKLDLDALEAREKNVVDVSVQTKGADPQAFVLEKETLLAVRTTKPPINTEGLTGA